MCDRPFSDVDEMNNTLIAYWNAMIGDNDEIYILGDLFYKCSGHTANSIVRQLKGKKYLIKGNHEKYLTDPQFDPAVFEWVKEYYELAYKDSRFILFHYPILEWAHYWRKSVHLYGHNHRPRTPISEDWDKRAINVGVDVNGFIPISAEVIYRRAFNDSVNTNYFNLNL
jgi:calcineurin-like phosphoesterase family protein